MGIVANTRKKVILLKSFKSTTLFILHMKKTRKKLNYSFF